MTTYDCLRAAKLLSVMGFAGGAIAAFVATDKPARKRAAHWVASPSLLATWLCGYALLMMRGVPLFELWVVGGVVLSLFANGVLAFCVARDRRGAEAALTVVAPIVCIVFLMVLKPTWASFR